MCAGNGPFLDENLTLSLHKQSIVVFDIFDMVKRHSLRHMYIHAISL